jgi:hypothetical protein
VRVIQTIQPIANDLATGTMEQELLQALGRVRPSEVRIATAYLTPDGFMALKKPLEGAEAVQ